MCQTRDRYSTSTSLYPLPRHLHTSFIWLHVATSICILLWYNSTLSLKFLIYQIPLQTSARLIFWVPTNDTSLLHSNICKHGFRWLKLGRRGKLFPPIHESWIPLLLCVFIVLPSVATLPLLSFSCDHSFVHVASMYQRSSTLALPFAMSSLFGVRLFTGDGLRLIFILE